MPAYRREAKLPGKSAKELYSLVERELDSLMKKLTVGQSYTLTPNPAQCSFRLDAKVVKATLQCTDGLLRLEGEMSFMLLPFKGKIDSAIDRWIEKTFGVKL